MAEKPIPEKKPEPLIYDEMSDWRVIAESTVDPPEAGQLDTPDDPTPVDGGSG